MAVRNDSSELTTTCGLRHSSSKPRAYVRRCSRIAWARFPPAVVRMRDSRAVRARLERCNVQVPELRIVRTAFPEIAACRTRMPRAVLTDRSATTTMLPVSRSVAPARLLPRRTAADSGLLRLRAEAIVQRVEAPMRRGRNRSVVPLSPRLLRIGEVSARSIHRVKTIAPLAGTAILHDRSHCAARASRPLLRTGVASGRSILPREARPRVAEQAAMAVAIGTALHRVPARSAVTQKAPAAERRGHNLTCVSRS